MFSKRCRFTVAVNASPSSSYSRPKHGDGKEKPGVPPRAPAVPSARTCLHGDVDSLPVGERLDAEVVPGPGLQAPQGAAVGAVARGGGLAGGRLPVLGAPGQAEVAGAARGAPQQPDALPGDAPLRQVGAASRRLPRRGLRRAGKALRDLPGSASRRCPAALTPQPRPRCVLCRCGANPPVPPGLGWDLQGATPHHRPQPLTLVRASAVHRANPAP